MNNHGFCSIFVEIHWSPQLRDLYENCGLRCQVPALWRRQWPCFCIKQHESWLPKWWIYWCLLRIYPVQTWVSRSFFWSPLKWNLTQDGTVALNTNCACQLDFNVWPWSKFLWCSDFLGIRSHGVYQRAQIQNSGCDADCPNLELSKEMHTLRRETWAPPKWTVDWPWFRVSSVW